MTGTDIKVWFPIKNGFFRTVVDNVKAVDGIDVTVRAGQTLGVVGKSGSGKTTLGLALARLISSNGTIQFDGRDIDELTFNAMRPLRRELQIVFQDPFGSLQPAHVGRRDHRGRAENPRAEAVARPARRQAWSTC